MLAQTLCLCQRDLPLMVQLNLQNCVPLFASAILSFQHFMHMYGCVHVLMHIHNYQSQNQFKCAFSIKPTNKAKKSLLHFRILGCSLSRSCMYHIAVVCWYVSGMLSRNLTHSGWMDRWLDRKLTYIFSGSSTGISLSL